MVGDEGLKSGTEDVDAAGHPGETSSAAGEETGCEANLFAPVIYFVASHSNMLLLVLLSLKRKSTSIPASNKGVLVWFGVSKQANLLYRLAVYGAGLVWQISCLWFAVYGAIYLYYRRLAAFMVSCLRRHFCCSIIIHVPFSPGRCVRRYRPDGRRRTWMGRARHGPFRSQRPPSGFTAAENKALKITSQKLAQPSSPIFLHFCPV